MADGGHFGIGALTELSHTFANGMGGLKFLFNLRRRQIQ